MKGIKECLLVKSKFSGSAASRLSAASHSSLLLSFLLPAMVYQRMTHALIEATRIAVDQV
jgi:hypothetical protein